MPKYSIVIPVYNVEKYIHQCLDSVLEQSFENFEIVILDDGSTDGSGSICGHCKAKFIIYHNEFRYIKAFGATFTAVAAAGAGHGVFQPIGNFEEQGTLVVTQRVRL